MVYRSPNATVFNQKRYHGHHGGQDPIEMIIAKPKDKAEAAAREVTLLGLWINLVLATGKTGVGYALNSMSLIGDGVHSLTDLISDGVTLACVGISRKKADRHYPYGYGRIETVGAVGVATFLLSAGVGIGYSSYESLMAGPTGLAGMGATIGIGTAIVSLVAKEWIYRRTIKVAEQQNSPVLYANAWHHRSDALSSVVALGGVAGAAMGAPWADPVGGFIVAGMVTKIGLEVLYSSMTELMDASLEEEELGVIRDIVHKANADSRMSESMADVQVGDLRVRRSGPFKVVDVDLVVPREGSGSTKTSASDLLKHAAELRAKLHKTDSGIRHITVNHVFKKATEDTQVL
eukprot:Clim_evm135s147 gene=Clim_evmTU135s147